MQQGMIDSIMVIAIFATQPTPIFNIKKGGKEFWHMNCNFNIMIAMTIPALALQDDFVLAPQTTFWCQNIQRAIAISKATKALIFRSN